MTGRRITLFSGGQGSYRAAKLDRLLHPDGEQLLVFTDTLYEDADTYRFLIEAAADVLGRQLNWSVRAEDFPDYRVPADVPLEEYAGNPDWRAFLADLRLRAMDALPELVWLVEGRDPWEVFRDRKFLGNSQRDPCSHHLKREVFAAWRGAHCTPAPDLFGDRDTFLVGIGDHEAHRYDDGEGRGIRPRTAAEGWAYEAPLLGDPMVHPSVMFSPIEQLGLRAARNYGLGYKHDNCGGMCVKGGHAHWQHRDRAQPDRYAYDAMMERKVIRHVGGGVAILTDRAGGDGKKPMTLQEFKRRLSTMRNETIEYTPGGSGCGCMLDEAA